MGQDDSSGKWTCGAVIALILLAAAYAVHAWRAAPPATPGNARLEVEQQAAARMAGVRCIGARASVQAKRDIARLLALDTLAPRGNLPPWLPATFDTSGADSWQTLAAACPNAPAFGTPFGFASAEIEKELRHDPEFAAMSDEQWAEIKRYEAGSTQQGHAAPGQLETSICGNMSHQKPCSAR